ncbi:KH domain-containing protein HEN4-like isoform X2 [Phragmites australis]|uniref:KH domain-containing protein HEN4-like isoform X2 n=1 Tax=Phragmites australis TaxID=29695 RepID=UPI002D7874F9|nr:KH domain-containing protein HEN4-like isoform X2 [Phragmites australis]
MDYDNSRRSNSKKRTRFNSDDGKRKRLNSRHDDTSMSSEPIETIYRILCPVKKIGSVLGRGGDIVKALREETKAKIRVADSIPGADERVIIIFNYQNQSERADEAAENISNDGLENMKPHCSAQDALLKIHDKIVADEVAHEKSETVDDVIARILVPGNQVGCLLGKGGSIIQQLRADTGAGIRVLPSENLPQCALKSDELVQISGVPSLVRKALYEISTRLHQHPRKENAPLEEIIDASTQRKRESPPPLPHGNPMLPHLHVDHPPPIPLLDPYRNGPLRYPVAEAEEFSVRILCASELIGSVIGKNGANVRQVEQQTGARIKVQEVGKDASGERLIIVSSKEIPADPISPTIEALIMLHDKVSAPSEKRHLSTRLVVPSSKVGCILGEGGKVITEMRRRTGAEIRVYSKADKPKYLSFDDELVQAAGRMHGCEDYRGLTGVTATGRFSSTIELRIPSSSLDSIVGVGGVNLAEIRQISGARLRLLEAHAGSSESVVEIQGTLDQTKAAQSLLQGFISANSRGAQQPSHSSRMPHYPSWG